MVWSCHGLSKKRNVSTARDVGKLACRALKEPRVREIDVAQAECFELTEPLDRVLTYMVESQVECVLVVKHDKLAGIFTLSGLAALDRETVVARRQRIEDELSAFVGAFEPERFHRRHARSTDARFARDELDQLREWLAGIDANDAVAPDYGAAMLLDDEGRPGSRPPWGEIVALGAGVSGRAG